MLTTLQQIPIDKNYTTVEFGALIITDYQKIFVSAGLGRVNFEGSDYYAISPAVPIYKSLSGMKKGDSAIFNGKRIEITEIW